MAQGNNESHAINTSLGQRILALLKVGGPGIVLVLTMMGAGDLVTAAVSGSSYGYNLMWLLALSLLLRYLILNIMGRFQIFNKDGMTILEGYARIHKIFPIFFGIAALLLGHLIVAQMIKGSGLALAWMVGWGDPFLWSIVVVVVSFLIMGKNAYTKLEWVMKALLAILSISFIGLAVYTRPNPMELIRGTIGFGLPDQVGTYGVFIVGIALVGSVAGSLTNLIYPYFLQDRGWIRPEHKRTQRNDLLFAFIAAIVIDLSIWVIGAEVLRPRGIQVNEISDIAKALEVYLGHLGAWIFYLGVFAIVYSSVIGTANGYGKVIVDSYYKATDKVLTKEHNIEDDKFFKWIALFLLISPLVWSIPGVTGFITLTLVTNALNVVGLPAIAIGLLVISNKKSYLGDQTNNWFENLALLLATLVTIWASWELLVGFFRG